MCLVAVIIISSFIFPWPLVVTLNHHMKQDFVKISLFVKVLEIVNIVICFVTRPSINHEHSLIKLSFFCCIIKLFFECLVILFFLQIDCC